MKYLTTSKSRFLNPDHNRVLHALLKHTFYVQFCAGETPVEVRRTIQSLKHIGYKGVVLCHAREVVLSKEEMTALGAPSESSEHQERDTGEITRWRDDVLETVNLTQEGDFVALKFTGAGRQALQHLRATTPCAPALRDAVHDICKLAQKRGVSLMFDAEYAWLQDGIDNWTMYYMKHYNKERAVVYGTYQAYAKRAPGLLARHLAEAQKNDFVLGVKLVRGAYMGSDPRELFWDSIEDTHKCYDNLAACVMRRKYDGLLQPAEGQSPEFPRVELMLASHNHESVRKAQAIRDQQAKSGEERIRMTYGQLMGMADHVSCEIVQQANTRGTDITPTTEIPHGVKYLTWGSLGITMKYLLRRAYENQDAVSRTIDARKALGREIAVRLGLARA
ncbi:proline dehydrogenase [Lithohypha guttulata]|nr:proline dehydrogenase [Lithohypha guttulata]